MNKVLLTFIMSLSILLGYSQENKTKKIYIYIDVENFSGFKGEYTARFIIKSLEKPFSHDIFSFRISDFSGNKKSIFSLGKRVFKDSIKYIVPQNYYANKVACEIHKELSLLNPKYNGEIFIITKIPKERLSSEIHKEKKYLVWEVMYIGTVKDFTYTSLGKSIFLK